MPNDVAELKASLALDTAKKAEARVEQALAQGEARRQEHGRHMQQLVAEFRAAVEKMRPIQGPKQISIIPQRNEQGLVEKYTVIVGD